ncbi:MAG: Fe-S-containing protein [Actinomycetaceae bacterium]|nr:Fe-S-containing protein [Actinomycetaceae bacterium]
MLKQLVDVVSALMLVGLTLGALFPAIRLATGRDPARPGPRPVLWGALAGALISLVVMVVHEYSIIRFNRQRLTLTTLEPTVVIGIIMLILVWIYGRRTLRALAAHRKSDERSTILSPNPIARRPRLLVAALGAAWALLIVFRDSQLVFMQARTFVPVGATVFSTETFLNVLGYVCGLALVIVAAVSVLKICQARPAWIPPILTALVVIISLTHIFLIIRLLHAIRVIYLPLNATRAMSWLINHEVWFIFAALAITLLSAIILWVRGRHQSTAGINPAVQRLERAKAQSMTRRSYLGLATYTASLAILTVGVKYATQEVELSEPEPYDLTDDAAVIPLERLNDGHLHRFVYDTSSGVQVRWIVIQKAGSSYGVGLDACEICGPSGYYEQDGQVICKLCSVAMNIATIGFKGGCNPIPIDYEVGNGVLSIPLTVLEESATVFS